MSFPDSNQNSESPAEKPAKFSLRRLVLGKRLDPSDKSVFHHISLIAFFAWVGLGADGLSSSCYGPAEAFQVLGEHTFLALFVGLASAVTIFVISTSYSQIIELFPSGGGGYLVASKLLSPTTGMVSGCALLIDYVLTIALSVASGADAVFSFLPPAWLAWKETFALAGVVLLTLINLRGVKESITILIPIFMVFVLTHAFVIFYGLGIHASDFSNLVAKTTQDVRQTHAQLGMVGMFMLFIRAYSMGAGTYTGIEAVSNGLPILRDPKVRTGKRTMMYMALSLTLTVLGLFVGYLLFDVRSEPGKTLNAVLFEAVTNNWGMAGSTFVLVTLLSEAAILFVAAQAGFLDGPRVLANMAQDRWFPTKFALLSDRLVTQNGVLLMGGASLALILVSHGSVNLLIVLYSINVFITFVLSQLGMVRHWWQVRGEEHWKKKLAVNGVGLLLSIFILTMIVIFKFEEGGWATILITGLVVTLAVVIKRHYQKIFKLLKRLDNLVTVIANEATPVNAVKPVPNPSGKTAVILVSGYNGLGLHTLLNVFRLFGREYSNYVFIQVGMVDAGVFKGAEEVNRLQQHIQEDLDHYVKVMTDRGYWAEGVSSIGIDVVQEIVKLAPSVQEQYPNCVFFGGQVVFPEDSFWTRLLHNYVVFAVQRQLYRNGIPFMIMPIRV